MILGWVCIYSKATCVRCDQDQSPRGPPRAPEGLWSLGAGRPQPRPMRKQIVECTERVGHHHNTTHCHADPSPQYIHWETGAGPKPPIVTTKPSERGSVIREPLKKSTQMPSDGCEEVWQLRSPSVIPAPVTTGNISISQLKIWDGQSRRIHKKNCYLVYRFSNQRIPGTKASLSSERLVALSPKG